MAGPRHGIAISDLGTTGRKAAHRLLVTALSRTAFAQAVTIMAVEEILDFDERGRQGNGYTPQRPWLLACRAQPVEDDSQDPFLQVLLPSCMQRSITGCRQQGQHLCYPDVLARRASLLSVAKQGPQLVSQ